MKTILENERLFASAPVNQAVLTLAIPTVISQLITVVYNMADTFFIGQLGDPNQVAAATLAMPIFMFLTAFANLFGIGGSSVISRCLGIGDYERAKHCSAFCIWASIIVSFIYGVAIIAMRGYLLPILGANAQTSEFCASYIFWTIGIGAVPTVMNAGLAHLIRSEGYSGRASVGVAFGGILNIVLDFIFVFLFELGIKGAAIATMLSNVAATFYFFIFLFRIRKKSTITFSLQYFTLKKGIPMEVVTVGLPSFIMTFMSTLSNMTLNKIIASYSNAAVAGMGIAKKIDLIAFAIAQGMTQGTLPLIGYNFSAKKMERMSRILKVLVADCLIVAFAGALFMFLAANPITQCFIDDVETVGYGCTFLRIVCLACPTTALNFLVITVFQATGRKVEPMVLSLFRKGGLDIPLMLILNAFVGINEIAWATPLADFLALGISLVMVVPYLKRCFCENSLTSK